MSNGDANWDNVLENNCTYMKYDIILGNIEYIEYK